MAKGEVILNKFAKRLKALMNDHDDSMSDIADVVNLSNSTISRYLNTKMSPKVTTVKELARYFKVNPSWLMGYNTEKYLPETIQEGVAEVPIIGEISAGEPLFSEKNILGYAKASSDDLDNGKYFYLKVTGDSMINAGIYAGDLVLIKKTSEVKDGDIVAVLCNCHEVTLKRIFFQDEKILLQPENPSYKPAIIDPKESKVIGKAVKVQRDLN